MLFRSASSSSPALPPTPTAPPPPPTLSTTVSLSEYGVRHLTRSINPTLVTLAERVQQYPLHTVQMRSALSIFNKIGMNEWPPIIIHGPSGIGKYSFALSLFHHHSPSKLKQESRIHVPIDKTTMNFRCSDIHVEIPMDRLGKNARLTWNDIYTNVRESFLGQFDQFHFNSRTKTTATSPRQQQFNPIILLCLNMERASPDLIQEIYMFLQENHRPEETNQIPIRFIFHTTNPSGFPYPLQQICFFISLGRPSSFMYRRSLTENTQSVLSVSGTTPLASLIHSLEPGKINSIAAFVTNSSVQQQPYKPLCNLLLITIGRMVRTSLSTAQTTASSYLDQFTITKTNVENDFCFSSEDILKIREHLYLIYIYQLPMIDSLWYIFTQLIEGYPNLSSFATLQMTLSSVQFFQQYNVNYRPILHVELLIVSWIRIICCSVNS